LEEVNILKIAADLNFPLSSFTPSFGAGLTQKGDFHDPAGKPADIVIIEMGYNDEGKLSPAEAVNRMRQRKWYTVLRDAYEQVKFVIFVNQPNYKQVCPPKKAKYKKNWVYGALVEGSKWTDQAVQVVQQELGIQALTLTGSVEELFGGMLETDAEGTIWQAISKGGSYKANGMDFSENGEPALWEDSLHPTGAGAEVHCQCLIKAFRARFESLSAHAAPSMSSTPAAAAPTMSAVLGHAAPAMNVSGPTMQAWSVSPQQAWNSWGDQQPSVANAAHLYSRGRSRSRERQSATWHSGAYW
jgi:hypothetical protein